MSEQMMSVADVATLLGLSTKTIRRAIDDGRLRASKPCGRLLIRASDVDAWLEASEVEPRATRIGPSRERARARPATTQAGGLRELLDDEKGSAA